MAIPDGKPATDFSAMNREWVRAVADEAASSGGSGIPAPENPSDGDVLTYDSTTSAWVAEAPSGGGGVGTVYEGTIVYDYDNQQATITVHHGASTAATATVNDLNTDLMYGPVYLHVDGWIFAFDHSQENPYEWYKYAMVPLAINKSITGEGVSSETTYNVIGDSKPWDSVFSEEYTSLSDNIVLTLYLNEM